LKTAERSTYQADDGVTTTRQLATFPIPLLKKLMAMYRLTAISLFHRGSRLSYLNNSPMGKRRCRLRLQKASTPKITRPRVIAQRWMNPRMRFWSARMGMIQSEFKKDMP
jgi:hypothetical protein